MQRLAVAKAAAVARDGEVVIAADTTVSIDGHIIGKPADRAEALDTLRALSGRTHTVYTGLAVLSPAGTGRRDRDLRGDVHPGRREPAGVVRRYR